MPTNDIFTVSDEKSSRLERRYNSRVARCGTVNDDTDIFMIERERDGKHSGMAYVLTLVAVQEFGAKIRKMLKCQLSTVEAKVFIAQCLSHIRLSASNVAIHSPSLNCVR